MTITVEVYPRSGGATSVDAGPESWDEEVAPGETLGRLLARLTVEQPRIRALFDPTTRTLAPGTRLAVNGRDYQLVGGLTYFLANSDRLSFTGG